jgi:conjugal transfer/entry exclusion protein
MANEKLNNVMTLPLEVRKQLEVMDSDITKARNAVATLKKVGVDVSAIDSKLKWAEEVRSTLLAEFK